MKPGQIMCVCGEAYWPKLAWKHADCVTNEAEINSAETNSAINAVINSDSVSNDQPKRKPRRNRENYNAYMRDYMKRKRAKARQ